MGSPSIIGKCFVGSTTAAGLLTGCVSQGQYHAIRLQRDRLHEQLARAESERDAAKARAATFKYQLDHQPTVCGPSDLSGLITNLAAQNADLRRQLDEAHARCSRGYTASTAPAPHPR